MIVLGLLAIAFPVAASITTTYVVAWVLIVGGLTHLLFAWRTEHMGSVLWTGFVGLVYVLVGAAILAHPLWGATSIALVLSVALMVEGLLAVIAFFTVDHTSKWVLFSGFATMVLATIVASGWVSNSLWLIGSLVGVNLLVKGASDLAAWIEGGRLSHLRAP
jgi:uncharacterized membrane protein HdeD (DUF308 family)